MVQQTGGNSAHKTVSLKLDEFISDHVNELPTQAGMHLVVAPTGAGKSHAMTQHSANNNGAVIFPVKAVMMQQEQETERRGINANIYQLEKFDDAAADKVDVIHFDECQLIYEGGFRKDVERFTALLIEQSKTKPIYCYSATYLQEIDFIKWDSVTVYDKEFRREYTVIQVEKDDVLVDSGKQIRQFRTSFAAGVVGASLERKVVVLVFVNSKSKCLEIKEQILAVFPHFKIEISCSESNQESAVIQHIMRTSTVTGCGADIILSTSSLEAGININDPVCIISEQTEAGKVFQRFGRARGVGYYYLFAGNGEGRVELQKSGVTVADETRDVFFAIRDTERNTLSQYMSQSCKFDNREHAAACDRYKSYIEQCDSLRNTNTVLFNIDRLGYKLTDRYSVSTSDNSVKCRRGSKIALCKCIRDHFAKGKQSHSEQLDELIINVVKVLDVDRMTANVHIQKFLAFRTQMQLVNNIKQDALDVYEKLTTNGQYFILSLSMNENKTDSGVFENELMTLVNDTVKTVRSAAGNVIMTGDKLDEWCDKFWKAVVNEKVNIEWYGDDNTRTRTNLFRYLMGWVENKEQKRWEIIEEKAWWDVELDLSEQKKLSKIKKELNQNGIRIEQVCEHTGMNTKEISLNYSPKKLTKHLKSDAVWGV
ncbi:hypothetical protein HNP10_002193 [Aeromonas veronii]|uniref:DEAD/DEAH box helicase family protein n=1 Tax=Aeromonas veronii TaxID=654 RepID=UPI0016165B59|nr:DEAD/DEAH box helicase family protein [Aeromonas veronii]MCS3833432.1 hypothetical protein [Aeromonas veronii]